MKHLKRALCLLAALCLLCPLAASAKEGLYTAIITRNYPDSTTRVYAQMDKNSTVLTQLNPGAKLVITAVYPGWVEVQRGNDGVGYILRHRVDNVEPIDPVNTPHYGVEFNQYYTVISQDTLVYSEKSRTSETLSALTPGAKVAFVGMEDGWGKLVYKRQYGYIDTRDLSVLYPVAKNAELEGSDEMPIAVYMSFFSDNPPRIHNLAHCCERLNRVMQPGESLDFNGQVGPFSLANGFQNAPILVDGKTVMGPGGGSCQISSTLYNAVLQLPGITVLERHPHGANGATYLPHGTDASSGALNFRIQNDYDFPIRIDASLQDLALFMAIYKEADQ